jgi:hypothetical protein
VRKRHPELSITHISFRQQEAELNIREPAKTTPHHTVLPGGASLARAK